MNKFKFYILPGGGCSLLLIILFYLFKPPDSILDSVNYSSIVYDRNGKVLRVTLSEDEKYRIYTHLDDSGHLMKEAILLKEDRYFYYHPGVNLISIARAFYQTYIRKGKKIGGSTITMQVARLKYQLNSRSIYGKLKQIAYAVYLEIYYSKDDILEAYINIAPCGGNVEGFAAGSLIYFKKELIDLTLQEALFLSILPQDPSSFIPKSKTVDKKLVAARKRLYSTWKERNPESSKQAMHIEMPMEVQYHIPFEAPHYTTELLKKYPQDQKICGTLDLNLQNTISRLTTRYIDRNKNKSVNNAAVLLVDAGNMQVLASLGSADFFNDKIEGQVNGTKARRSPGSTLKPFIYALAMEQGLIHPMTMLKDAPISFSEYAPDNFERDFKGPIKAWQALISSRNVPAVALASHIKQPDLYDFLSWIGVGGKLKDKKYYGLSLVLGSLELSMEELVTLYGIIANDGVYKHLEETIVPLQVNYNSSEQYLSPEVCFLIESILTKNPRPKSGWSTFQVQSKLPVAYKTGTSIGFKDCWSIGVVGHYIIAVWLGNFNGYGNPTFNGRYLATPLMFEIIDSIYPELKLDNELNDLDFLPDNIKHIKICAVSGQIAHPHCTHEVPTLFIPGKSPITKCQICREIYIDTRTGFRTSMQKGKFIEKRVFEFWPTDLLAIFRKAGIPRNIPPTFDPKVNLDMQSVTGIPPEIMSPVQDIEYLLQQGTATFNDLPLIAVADADVKELYWFIDQKYIGKSNPNETQYWSLSPGIFQICVVDDHGRSDCRSISIGVASN